MKSSCELGGTGIPDGLSASLQDIGLATERALTDILAKEQELGQFSSRADPSKIAGYLLSVVYGLSVPARRGKSCEELEAIAELGITALLPPGI